MKNLGGVLCLALAGCAGPLAKRADVDVTQAAHAAVSMQKPVRAKVEPRPFSEYVPTEAAALQEIQDFGDVRRVLANGIRFAHNEPPATDAPSRPLVGGVLLPDYLGHGFLFWNDTEFYRSDTFTGTLRPAGRLPGRLYDVRFGRTFLLLHLARGARAAWSLDEQALIACPYPGLIDVVSLRDGRSALLLEPNTLWLRGAGQSDYLKVNDPSLAVTEFHVTDTTLALETKNGYRYEVTRGGQLALAEPRAKPEQRVESLREIAFKQGAISAGDGQACVLSNGALAKINLRTGQIVASVRSALLELDSSQLIHTATDDIALGYARGELRVITGLRAFAPRLERSFPKPYTKYRIGYEGDIVIIAPCDSAPNADASSICMRSETGEWKEHRTNSEMGADERAPEAASWVARWLPVGKGAALGFVLGKNPGIYDTRTRSITVLSKNADLEHIESFTKSHHQGEAAELADGTIVAYLEFRGVKHWTRDGQALPMPNMSDLRFSGPFAIGRYGLRLWQSLDHGQTWAAIRPPPHVGRLDVKYCSRIGCIVGDWYRLGYPRVPTEFPALNLPSRSPIVPNYADEESPKCGVYLPNRESQ